VQLCGTTPCVLRGAEDLKKVCHKRIGEQMHVTPDGKFSWIEVECLGACVNAPMVQINYDFYEDLTADSLEDLIDELAAGMEPKPGPQIDRQFSAPVGGPTTLTAFNAKAGTHKQRGAAISDKDAKKPGAAADVREAAVPKPPLGGGTK
jgi:NADH-quinone oxidoreductase subunit E